jgi:predicted aspartyl protease
MRWFAAWMVIAIGAISSVDARPRSAQQRESTPDEIAIHPVPSDRRAPVFFQNLDNHLFLEVEVAGRKVEAILDTGAEVSFLDLGFARTAGLELRPHVSVRIAEGRQMQAWRVSGVAVAIAGQFELDYRHLTTLDMAAISRASGRKVAFVLGRDVLRNVALVMDPLMGQLEFHPSGTFHPTDAVRIDLLEHNPVVELEINAQKARVLIDTGFSHTVVLPDEIWPRVFPIGTRTGTVVSLGPDGGELEVETAIADEIRLGSLRIPQVRVGRGSSSDARTGLLGMEILGQFQLALDLKAGWLWLTPLSRASARP